MPTETALREAIAELHTVVKALQELIEREYPRREEIEHRFTAKSTSRKRWWAVVALIPIMGIVSAVTTITTVSTCFLRNFEGKEPPAVCSVMPGYQQTLDRNNRLIRNFTTLIETTEKNERQIKKLQRELRQG